MAPDYGIWDHRKLPQSPGVLWDGPWQWGTYEVTTVNHALELAARGVKVIESMAAGDLAADPRLVAGSGSGN